ncbi:MAG TPA: COX15/CtaA family protein [Pyrinomonadaceae bacterium]|nr:COX15/CtaA family protein [Pyrinomonadaceae bacterium]
MKSEQIQTPPRRRFAVYAWGVLAYNLAVILWGAYVRASVSGNGCGSHWPLCNGEVIPTAPQLKTLIEFAHRLTSGLSVVLLVVLVVWAWRVFPREHRVRRAALLSVVFIFTEALVGAGLVLFEKVAQDASPLRALFMSVHLVNTFILLAVLALTAWWATGAPRVQLREQGSVPHLFALGLCGTLLLAVSGAIAALGDTLYPARTFAEGFTRDFSPAAHFLLRLRVIHPALALLVGCYVVLTASYVSNFLRPTERVKRLTTLLVTIFLLQLGAGLLNLYLLAPVWLQLTHLFLADALWLALVLTAAAALAQPSAQVHEVEAINLRPAEEL